MAGGDVKIASEINDRDSDIGTDEAIAKVWLEFRSTNEQVLIPNKIEPRHVSNDEVTMLCCERSEKFKAA
jgi:hypothetical protein